MLKKIIDFVTGERGRTKQLVATLDDFLDNAKSNSLTEAQAKKNLEEGVIELFWRDGQHAANGLLISDDGYFLTARHCVENPPPKYIRLYDGSEYPFEKVVVWTEPYVDLALAKAKVPGDCKSKRYTLHTEEVKSGTQINLYCLWNGWLLQRNGQTETDPTHSFFPSHLFDDIKVINRREIVSPRTKVRGLKRDDFLTPPIVT